MDRKKERRIGTHVRIRRSSQSVPLFSAGRVKTRPYDADRCVPHEAGFEILRLRRCAAPLRMTCGGMCVLFYHAADTRATARVAPTKRIFPSSPQGAASGRPACLSLWERWHGEAVTERASGQCIRPVGRRATTHTPSVSLRSPALPALPQCRSRAVMLPPLGEVPSAHTGG